MEMNFRKSVPIFHCIIPHSLLLFAANPCAFEFKFCLKSVRLSPIQLQAFHTAGKSVNFMWICVHNVLNYIDLSLTQPHTQNENISFSLYIMNVVPEAQSENIKYSDASQGDSFPNQRLCFNLVST